MTYNELKKILDTEWLDVEYYDCVKPKMIDNIRCWWYIDIQQSYKKYNHPLIVFVSNKYGDSFTDDYFAISVSKSPVLLVEPKEWNIYRYDIACVMNFISNHYKELQIVADDTVQSAEYESIYDSLFKSSIENVNVSDFIEPVKEKDFIPTDKSFGFGTYLCHLSDGFLNIVKDDKVLFVDEFNKPIKFINIIPFKKNKRDEIIAAAYDNDSIYKLSIDGTFELI